MATSKSTPPPAAPAPSSRVTRRLRLGTVDADAAPFFVLSDAQERELAKCLARYLARQVISEKQSK